MTVESYGVPAGSAAELNELLSSSKRYVLAKAARHPLLSEADMLQLIETGLHKVCFPLLGRDDLSDRVLAALCEVEDFARLMFRYAGVFPERLLVEAVSKVLSSSDISPLIGAAAREDITLQVAEKLAYNGDPSTRCVLAANRNTPASVLRYLCHDVNVDVRSSVAWNRSSPESCLKFLRNADEREVVLAVVDNHGISMGLLELIASEYDSAEPFDIQVWKEAVDRLAAEDPRFVGYPREWVEATLRG